MTVIITGCSGFLASYIYPKLIGWEIVGVDTKESPEWIGIPIDITDYNQLEPLKDHYSNITHIIHLAAIAAPRLCATNPSLAFNINVNGTLNILKLAKETGAKVIFASSAHVYGISPRYMPSNEGHGVGFNADTYTTTKIIGEWLCKSFWENYNVPYVSIRLFNSYGPRQTPDYFIPAKIIEARDKHEIKLKGGDVVKDFVYVEDVADAYIKTMNSDFVGEINIGSGIKTKLSQIGEIIAKEFGVPLTCLSSDDNSPSEMQSSIERASKVLNWYPKTSLQEGLAKTIKSYKNEPKY
jgi:nucleoside-diphosphate-sugar epimerase